MYNTGMSLQKARRVIGVLLFICCGSVLFWGLSAQKFSRQTLELAPADLALPGDQAALEPRRLELYSPAGLRLGDDGSLRLTVSAAAAAHNQAASPSGVYADYQLILQARLDLPGVARNPTGEISQAMLPGQPQAFLWYMRPAAPGLFSGKVWLHLLYQPRSGAPEQRRLLAALPVELQVVRLLGLSGNQARLFGSLGLALGALLCLDGVLNWGLDFLARRRTIHE